MTSSIEPTAGIGLASRPAASKPRYVRPKHLRVMCDLCPEDSKDFRIWDYEYRLHFDRVHSRKKVCWVAKDGSGSGLLAECKACSLPKFYGVEYNAMTHLRWQHLSNDKNPAIRVSGNMRDLLKKVEIVRSDVDKSGRAKDSNRSSTTPASQPRNI